jgi:hypothetical protein
MLTSPNVSPPGRPLGPLTPAVPTGPRTREGKARASQNARKRPFSFTIVRIVPLVADAIAEHQPVNSPERPPSNPSPSPNIPRIASPPIEAGLFSNCLNVAMYTPEDANILQDPDLTQDFQPRRRSEPRFLAPLRLRPRQSPVPNCPHLSPFPSPSRAPLTAAPSTISTASSASAASSHPKIARQTNPLPSPSPSRNTHKRQQLPIPAAVIPSPKRTQNEPILRCRSCNDSQPATEPRPPSSFGEQESGALHQIVLSVGNRVLSPGRAAIEIVAVFRGFGRASTFVSRSLVNAGV